MVKWCVDVNVFLLLLSPRQLQGQGLGLTEMINAMAAQQHMYTAAAAYGSLEAAAYAQYPQYVAQVSVRISGLCVLLAFVFISCLGCLLSVVMAYP